MKLVGFMISLLTIILILFFHNNNVNAHNFYDNEASILFTLVLRYEVEDNLANNQTINKLLALNHSKNADNLFGDIVNLKKNKSSSSDFIDEYVSTFAELNTTTKALIAANLADEALKQYGLAKGLDPRDASSLLNMSIDMIMDMVGYSTMDVMNHTSGESSEFMHPMHGINQSSSNSSNHPDNRITNQVNYESSTSLAKSLRKLFSNNLKNSNLENTTTGLMRIPIEMKTQSVDQLEQGIEDLISSLNSYASLEKVYSIVHGQIHPNLFLAYDLRLEGK
jgi:hypothetical protein